MAILLCQAKGAHSRLAPQERDPVLDIHERKEDLAVSAAPLGTRGSVSMAHGTKKGDQFWNRISTSLSSTAPWSWPHRRVHTYLGELAEGAKFTGQSRAGGHGAERNEVIKKMIWTSWLVRRAWCCPKKF